VPAPLRRIVFGWLPVGKSYDEALNTRGTFFVFRMLL
jgi:hypothetical protein